MAEQKPAVAMATAVSTPVAAQATAVATPVVAQATAVAVPMQPVPHQAPTGAWSNTLCSCCDDGCTYAAAGLTSSIDRDLPDLDMPLIEDLDLPLTRSCPMLDRCLASFFCDCVVIAQLTERLTGQGGKCKQIAAILWVLYLIYLGLTIGHQVWGALSWGDDEDDAEEAESGRSGRFGGGAPSPLGTPANIASLLFWATAIYMAIQVRRRIRQRDNISEDGCTECLMVTFCHGCALSQMLRQLDITGSSYKLCSETGDGSPAGPARV